MNKTNKLQAWIKQAPGENAATPWSVLNRTWNLAGLITSSHLITLCGWRGDQPHIQSMRSGRRVRYLHPQAWKNHQKKKTKKNKTDALLLCPGFLFTDLNLPISCWEINYSNSYSNIPQMNQKWSTLLHHKIKTTWKDCVQELKKALGLSATSKHHQPHCTTMPPRISVVKKKKTHWNVKGENQNW